MGAIEDIRIGVKRFYGLRSAHAKGQGKTLFEILPIVLLGNTFCRR